MYNIYNKIYNKNKKLFFILNLAFSCSINYINSLGSLPKLFNLQNKEELFTTFDDTINRQLKILLDNKEKAKKTENFQKKLEEINEKTSEIKKRLSEATNAESKQFLQEKLSSLNQQYQALSEVEQVNHQIIQIIDSHMRLLCQYKQDPDFSKKNLRLEPKRIYTFNEVQKVYNKILDIEKELKDLEAKKKKSLEDLSNREKSLNIAKQKYQETKKQKENTTTQSQPEEKEENQVKLTAEDQADLMDQEDILLKYKKELAQQKVQEIKQRVSLLESEISTHKIELQILQNEYERIKGLVKVNEKEKEKAQHKLEELRQETSKKLKEFKEKIGALLIAQDSLEEQIEQYKEQYNINEAELHKISNWTYIPPNSTCWQTLVKVGKPLIKLLLNNISKQLLEAKSDFIKAQLKEQETRSSILTTWFKLTHTEKFNNQAEFNKEIKQYETLKTDIQSDLSSVSDKKQAITNLLNSNAKLLDNIKEVKKKLIDQKNTTFKSNTFEYNNLLSQIKRTENDIKSRGEIISKLNEIYISANSYLSITLKKVQGIIDELKNQAQWLGVSSSVWKGLKNFLPDIKHFLNDVKQAILGKKPETKVSILEKVIKYFNLNPYKLLGLILKLLSIIALSLLIKFYLPKFEILSNFGIQNKFGNKIISLFAIIINFVKNNLLGLLIWLCLFITFKQLSIINPYLGIIFYLLSIPYFIYYAHRFIGYLFQTNIKQDYFLISEEFNRKFFIIFSFLAYSTIVIFFFRQAFLLGHYPKSDVPSTLLAINFFLLQISLTFFISREQILSLIPTRSTFGQTIYELVDRYYYLFLAIALVIIFISNPYIGFGPHFFSIIVRIILIVLLIPLFTVVHTWVKRYSVSLFFKSKGGTKKERFSSAKTFYGIFIILSFLFLIILALIVAANIWGYSLGLEEIKSIIHKPLFPSGSFDRTGQPIFVTSLSLLQAVGFIILGLFTAYLVNKFILRRIFDLLLVNVGVQSALMSLTRYFILSIFLILALQTARLSSLLIYILAVLGGIGFAAKELVTDMLSYFIILIQRPLKIGDLVKIDDKIIGVVRQINLRSIILRSKNSVTVIIPNSYIMNNPVTNWNYSPTFFATNDISITIPYKFDPKLVRELIFKVLDQNINILKNPAPIIWLSDFAENGFLFTVRGFLSPDKVLDVWQITSDIRIEIIKILKENNIKIATPSRIIISHDNDTVTITEPIQHTNKKPE